jgi:hypothetical protein
LFTFNCCLKGSVVIPLTDGHPSTFLRSSYFDIVLLISMKSTPAVFCTPAFNTDSTPYISSPTPFEHESYPWAVHTPEDSPIGWDVIPNMHLLEPTFPRAQLRAACEPYFEQMLVVMEQSLQAKIHPGTDVVKVTKAMADAANSSFQSGFFSMPGPKTQYDRMPDEESTEADEPGAFSCLLSLHSSEVESIGSGDVESPIMRPPSPPCQDLDQGSDSERSSMVCRHWKTKGWCRLESNCKFLHPEHKRGVAAPNTGSRGGISGVLCPDMRTTSGQSETATAENDSYSASMARRKRRGGRNRVKRSQVGDPDQGVSDTRAQFLFGDHLSHCSPCIPFV